MMSASLDHRGDPTRHVAARRVVAQRPAVLEQGALEPGVALDRPVDAGVRDDQDRAGMRQRLIEAGQRARHEALEGFGALDEAAAPPLGKPGAAHLALDDALTAFLARG